MNMRLKSLALASLVAIGLLAGGSVPVKGEEDLGTLTKITEFGPYRYKQYVYPSKTNAFFMYPKSYVTFDTVNASFWLIESPKWYYDDKLNMDAVPGIDYITGQYFPRALRDDALEVSFFTPDMKLLGHFEGPIYETHYYPVPKDGNDYERIICKIETSTTWHYDIKMRMYDPVDPVNAEPMSTPIYRQ